MSETHGVTSRAAYYRQRADLMRQAAEGALDQELADAYLRLAAQWDGMAEQLQRRAGAGPPAPPPPPGPRRPNL